MTDLRAALDLISDYLEQEIAYQSLNPGLDFEDIERAVSILPFELPMEVYQLYMWRNGGSLESLPYPSFEDCEEGYERIHGFLPLNEAVEVARSWNKGWFPLFDTDGSIFWIVGCDEQEATAPIFINDVDKLPDEPSFESLTHMMNKLIEPMEDLK
jgi:hypothetical protein